MKGKSEKIKLAIIILEAIFIVVALSTIVYAFFTTNTTAVGKVEMRLNRTIEVQKVWNDNNNENGKRPSGVIIELKANGEVKNREEANQENNWLARFEDVPIYDNQGNEIAYKVDEQEKARDDLEFYSKEIGEIQNNHATITNTYERPREKIDITVNKVWVEDNEIQASRRPEQIILQVKDGETVVDEQLIDVATQTSYTFTGLYKCDTQGREIQYTVDEVEKKEGDLKFYTKQVGNVENNQATITNTFKVPEEKIEINVIKEWIDNNNAFEERPEAILIQLKKGEEILEEQNLSAEEDQTKAWTSAFKHIQKYDENGQEIQYTVDERDIPGYEKQISEMTDVEGRENLKQVTITNKIIGKTGYVRIKYLEAETEKELYEEQVIEGFIGNGYDLTNYEKYLDGYVIINPPEKTGEFTKNEQVKTFYYARKTSVEVHYLEKDSENELKETKIINGYVGKKYETTKEEIPYYNFVSSTKNEKGKMTAEKIIVKYYYEKQKFDLEVDKWLSSVTYDGITENVNAKDQLYKLDINRKKIKTADVRVAYTIRISNIGEIEGKVERLTELIPENFSFHQSDNKIKWKKEDNILVTEDLKNDAIKAGGHKDIEIILRWNPGENNLGEKLNRVGLDKVNNPANYKDESKNNNISKANMIISIATGLDRNERIIAIKIIEVVVLILIVISVIIFIIIKRRDKGGKLN